MTDWPDLLFSIAAIIAQIAALAAAVFSALAAARVRKVEAATNGMKKQLEKLAYERGVRDERAHPGETHE